MLCFPLSYERGESNPHGFPLDPNSSASAIPPLLRQGLFRAKYDAGKLSEELKAVYGAQTVLGGPELLTGLLVVTKRLDSGSPWPISNNPRGKYFAARAGGVIGNGDYPLWEVVRASTAAPVFLEPEKITIASAPGMKPVQGDFVDGGVSPFNNPALQALMYAPLEGYRISWPVGADKMLLVSVGTGAAAAGVKTAAIAAHHGIRSGLRSITDALGHGDFVRVLLGVGRPPAGGDVSGYVLSRFASAERLVLAELLDQAAAAVEAILTRGSAAATNEFNGRDNVA